MASLDGKRVRTRALRQQRSQKFADVRANPNENIVHAAQIIGRAKARRTVFEAIDLNVSAPVITESLIRRIRSREENNFTDRMLSIMRNAFGGHAVKKD